MRVVFVRSFDRDLERVRDGALLARVFGLIDTIESCGRLVDVPGVKRLVGFGEAYRVRIGEYRLGLFVDKDDAVKLVRFLHRKDIYRTFP